MTPERWQHVAELCDSALSLQPSRRAAFLEEACAGDALLRQDLEALLACDERSPHFLETPALEAAASALIEQETEPAGQPLPAGLQIGPYRIVAPLGAGGTGYVYRGADTRRGRDVALEFLPSGPAGPKERTGLWVLPVAGGPLRKLEEDAWGPAPSPDGSRIAFRRASGTEIWLINAAGREPRRLVGATPGYSFEEELVWSPDGRYLAFGEVTSESNAWVIENLR